MPDKFYMISAVKDKQTLANIYDNYDKFKQDFSNLKDKLELRTFLLTPVQENEDIIITQLQNKTYIACLEPKQELKDPKFIKCAMQEIKAKQ